eukprot:PhF_6_TR28136/c0_g1_i4/m.41651/K07925/RAB39B; Ras-related protein Rab-39B
MIQDRDDDIFTLHKSKHVTVVPMVILSSAAADMLHIPFDAVRHVLSMTATPPPPTIRKYEGESGFQHKFRLILVGESGCGKSSFISRVVRNRFTEMYNPTIVFHDVSAKFEYEQSLIIELCFVDIAGPDTFRSYRNVAGCFLCFDVTNRRSFERAHSVWLRDIKSYVPSLAPLVLLGLKADLGETDHREVTSEEAEGFGARDSMPYIECSAKDNFRVFEAVESMVKLCFAMMHQPKEIPIPIPHPKQKC